MPVRFQDVVRAALAWLRIQLEIAASRDIHERGGVGEVGPVVFRGRHLRELLQLSPGPTPDAAPPKLRGTLPRLHPAAAVFLQRFDERTGMSCLRPPAP